jgi:uncharacterized Zn finger protein (UPF0148 family)
MSDDFDKEAERQRLREKYEADKEDREATERMSELLLQGATMTNRHCDTCGSPIFRYQGQAFCPNCQMGESAGETAAETAEGAPQAATERDEQAGQQPGQQPAPRQRPQQPATQQNRQPATQQNRQPATQQDQQPTQPSQPQQGAASGRTAEGASVPPVDAESLEEIRASLTQTLARFARRAAQTEDPHRAREHLDTAKRAAETLRELQR